MGYTLAELERLTLSHLYRLPTDQSIPQLTLRATINSCRRNFWRELGQTEPNQTSYDLVAGQRDYVIAPTAPSPFSDEAVVVPEGVTGVSWKASPSDEPCPLRFVPFPHVPSLYPCYPENPDGAPGPEVYWLRTAPLAGAYGSRPAVEKPFRFQAVSLFPEPLADVAGGLIVTTNIGALDLVEAHHESSLPRIVDEAACWRAAVELIGFIWLDERAPGLLDYLATMQLKAEAEARRVVMDMFGSLHVELETWAGFATPWDTETITEERSYGYSSQPASTVTRMWVQSANVPTATSFVIIDCSAHPPVTGATVLAFSKNEALVGAAVVSGTTIVVTADSGMEFDAGDIVYTMYEALR